MDGLGIGYLVTAAVVAVAAVPPLLGWVRMNHWYGIRIPAAFESEESWYAVNRYGARWLLAWAGGIAALGLVCLLLPAEPGPVALAAVLLGPLALLWVAVVAILRYGDRLTSR